jgi:hypothetical protein
MVIFPALTQLPGAAAEKLCRDCLALTDDEARPIAPPLFEEAGKALLAVSPNSEGLVDEETGRDPSQRICHTRSFLSMCS